MIIKSELIEHVEPIILSGIFQINTWLGNNYNIVVLNKFEDKDHGEDAVLGLKVFFTVEQKGSNFKYNTSNNPSMKNAIGLLMTNFAKIKVDILPHDNGYDVILLSIKPEEKQSKKKKTEVTESTESTEITENEEAI